MKNWKYRRDLTLEGWDGITRVLAECFETAINKLCSVMREICVPAHYFCVPPHYFGIFLNGRHPTFESHDQKDEEYSPTDETSSEKGAVCISCNSQSAVSLEGIAQLIGVFKVSQAQSGTNEQGVGRIARE